jgi:hypothetical protein
MEIMQRFRKTLTEREKDMDTILKRNHEEFKFGLREAVVMEVLNAFP